MSTTIPHPADVTPVRRFRHRARTSMDRARALRRRSHLLPDELAPLRAAMRRRACELELESAAFDAVASGALIDPPGRPAP